MIIDSHVLLGEDPMFRLDTGTLLALMDRHQVDRAVVGPVGRHVVIANREGNDFITAAVREAPDRLIGLASVNPWHGADGIAELRRALDNGLRGLKMHPPLQGVTADDLLWDPLLDVCAQAGVPVLTHSGLYMQSELHAIAALARRHPRVTLIAGHMGFTDGWFDLAGAAGAAANLCFETSYVWGDLIASLVGKIGPRRLIFGSGIPKSDYRTELGKLQRLGLTAEQRAAIMADNAIALWKIRS